MGSGHEVHVEKEPGPERRPWAPSGRAGEQAPVASSPRARMGPRSLSSSDVLHLQRTIGNGAVQRLLEDAGGLERGTTRPEEEEQDLGGGTVARQRTFGEFVGDVARPVGVFAGNVVGEVAEALTGIEIESTTTTPAAWNNHMQFLWEVGFTTTGRSGWIVQEIVNKYRAEDTAGNPVGPIPTPHYWEAWAVDAAGRITPASGATHDTWRRGSRGDNTKGHWSMRGKVHFTKTDPAAHGFTAGGAPNAGILLSTTSAPTGLPLGIARLHRYAQGTWDSTGAVKTHTGSAGPL